MNQNLLQKINEKKRVLDSLWPFPEEKNRLLQEKLRLEWTYNSNAIEGNSLTLKETAFFIREGLTVEGKPLKDFLEAKNHIEAIGFLENAIKEKREISESFIKELNALLLKGITVIQRKNESGQIFEHKIYPGEYKKQPNYVLTFSGKIHEYCEPLKVTDEVGVLLKWYKNSNNLHPVELATEFHYRFVAIHPFDDGNGRMARLLMNIILMKESYFPIIVPMKERRRYLEALETADSGDLNIFKDFIAEKMIEVIDVVLGVFNKNKK